MSQINNIVKVQISKFLGYKLPPVPEDESIGDIDKYKIYDFDFTKGKLPDGVEFYRLSRDWDWDGNEYDIDQPVLYEEGLWNWGERTNFIANNVILPTKSSNSVTITRWGNINEIGGWGIFESGISINNTEGSAFYYIVNKIGLGEKVNFSLFLRMADGSRPRLTTSTSSKDHDLRLIIEGSVARPEDVEFDFISDNVWRLSVFRQGRASNFPNFGVNQSVDHSGKTIDSWGYQISNGVSTTPTIPTKGSIFTVTGSKTISNINLRKDFTLFGSIGIEEGSLDNDSYLFTLGRDAYPERYIGLKLNRITNKLQLDSSVGVSKESVKTYKAGDIIKFAVVRCRDRFGVVINGEEFLEINFKVNFLNSDLNKLFFGNYFDSDEHILPSYIKHFAIYDKPFNTNTLIHMTEVEDGDS